MIEREEYWGSLWKDSATQKSLISDHPYVKIAQLIDADFTPIRQIIFQAVAQEMDPDNSIDVSEASGRNEVLEALEKTKFFSMKDDLELMTQLDARVTRVFKSLGLLNGIEGIQFPVKIRVAHPEPPQGYAEKDYATDHIHCDPWSGEPPDMVNTLLYIQVDDNSSTFQPWVVEKNRLDKLAQFEGVYADAAPLVYDLEPVQYQPRSGQLFVFDGFTPHNTVRHGTSIRISIEVRFRRESPYSVFDEHWAAGNQGWDRYWSPNTEGEMTFDGKCEAELAMLERNGNSNGAAHRRDSIEQLRKSAFAA